LKYYTIIRANYRNEPNAKNKGSN